MPAKWIRLVPLALVAVAASACLPDVVIKRSALVPAPAGPAITGRPLERGDMKITAGLNPVMLEPARLTTFVPTVGAPGLYLPTAELTGSAYFGLEHHWEVGAQVDGAPFAWARPTSDGVLGLPDSGKLSSLTAGVGARWSRRLGDWPMWFAVSGELNVANVPQAVYVKCGCDEGGETWALDHTEDNLFVLPNLFLHLGGDVGEHLHLSALGGWETGITNVGFEADPSTLNSSTLSTYGIDVVGAGAELRYGALRIESNLLVPVAGDPDLTFAPELTLRVSAVL